MLRRRLTVLVSGPSAYAMAVVCTVIALLLPFMELVPFSAHAVGLALVAFGLSLIAADGLLALLAFAVTVGTCALALVHLA